MDVNFSFFKKIIRVFHGLSFNPFISMLPKFPIHRFRLNINFNSFHQFRNISLLYTFLCQLLDVIHCLLRSLLPKYKFQPHAANIKFMLSRHPSLKRIFKFGLPCSTVYICIFTLHCLNLKFMVFKHTMLIGMFNFRILYTYIFYHKLPFNLPFNLKCMCSRHTVPIGIFQF